MVEATMVKGRTAHAQERTEYRAYFLIAYPFFFLISIFGRLFRFVAPARSRMRAKGSVFEEAAEIAHSVIPWVFSGR
ncbi:MAG: hypothetical protein AAGJ73_00460 [Pseudomonadota bacterium]